MAKKYSTNEVKSLLDKHDDNLRQLADSYALQIETEKQLQSHLYDMLFWGTFSKIVMNYIEGRPSDDSAPMEELVQRLCLYKRVTVQSHTCRELLRNNVDRIVSLIKEAAAGANPVTWFFSSAKKKQRSVEAYEALVKEIADSDYWKSSQHVLNCISQNEELTEQSSWDDLRSNIDEYRDILTKNLPKRKLFSESIREIDHLTAIYEDIASRLKKEASKTDDIKNAVKTAVDRMIMTEVLDILKTIPVEETAREKKGIRVKALREAGYGTMADLYTASSTQLATVNGISGDTSYSLKDIAQGYAHEASQHVKIRLNVDHKTKEATELVLALYTYRRYTEALTALDKLHAEYGHRVEQAMSDLHLVGNGIYWLFFDEQKRQTIKKSYAYLNDDIKTGHCRQRSEMVADMFRHAATHDPKGAWDDFQNHSVVYYTILEEIVPGVLGNDDRLYGLPEDLAREIQDECFFPDGLQCELRRYQEWGVKYILHQERVLLGDEMGLGKTIQAIATMVSLKNTGAGHFIVVCPASVLPNWCKEIAAKSKLRVTKVHGVNRIQALQSWMRTGGVAVTTYETTGIFTFDEAFTFDLLVVDEAHYIKNKTAIRSQNVRRLARFTKRMLFMTGTALENNVDEMISLIEILQPTVARTIQGIAFMSTASHFREKIAGVYYRRKREDVLTELPDLIENREWCTMSDAETRLYEQEVLNRNFMGTRRLSWNVDNLDMSCKASRMMSIITEAENEGRKVLVFSFFLDTIRKIVAYLGDRCCHPINGSLQPQKRQEIIDQFNADPKKTVLCAQIQSGGTGLNIQAASVVIICEPQFKPSIENQAISRAYRMGQARNVLVYRLLCENTIDEKIMDLLEEKQAVFQAFADKSVAAAQTDQCDNEVDETTFGRIIEEEIERIAKKENVAKPKDVSLLKVSQTPKKKVSPPKQIENDLFVAQSALTSSAEYTEELSMTYDQLVHHLQQKYGKAKGNYFLTETCRSQNTKIVRTSEGLYCHHIDEDKAIMLSSEDYATKNPFDYQKADRLVYCNILEHLLLHVKIVEEPRNKDANEGEIPGLGGAKNFLIRQINDYYNGYSFKKKDIVTAMSFIEDNYEDYIRILQRFWSAVQKDKQLSRLVMKEQLAWGWNHCIVRKVYDRL